LDEGEWKVGRKTDDLYTIILKISYTLYGIKLKICTQSFYCSSSKFSKFIQGKSPLLQHLASVSLLKEKSKIFSMWHSGSPSLEGQSDGPLSPSDIHPSSNPKQLMLSGVKSVGGSTLCDVVSSFLCYTHTDGKDKLLEWP